MPSCRWPKQNKTKFSTLFGGSFSNNVLSGHFSPYLIGPLHIYDAFWFFILMGFLCVQTSVAAAMCVSCTFSSAVFLLFTCLFNSILICFISSYFSITLQRPVGFLRTEQKGCGCGWGLGKLRRVGGGETLIRML